MEYKAQPTTGQQRYLCDLTTDPNPEHQLKLVSNMDSSMQTILVPGECPQREKSQDSGKGASQNRESYDTGQNGKDPHGKKEELSKAESCIY